MTIDIEKTEKVEVQFDFIISSLIIFLLLFSVIVALMLELQFFDFLFESLKTDFETGFYTVPSIILSIILLLPTAFAFFFFIYGFLEILTNRLRLTRMKDYLVLMTFGLYALPLLLLLYAGPLFIIIALVYLVFILYALKNYLYFTSKEIPESLNKALDYKLPLLKFSFSRLKPRAKTILFVAAVFLLAKNLLFQLPVLINALVTIKDLLVALAILSQMVGTLISLLNPVSAFLETVISGLNLSFLRPILAPFTFVEFILVKLVMYLFVLDFKALPARKVDGNQIQIGNIASSGFLLIGLRDINIEDSIYWLSTLSLLTVLMGEFLFTFIDIIAGSSLKDLLSFILTTGVWSLVLFFLLKEKFFPAKAS